MHGPQMIVSVYRLNPSSVRESVPISIYCDHFTFCAQTLRDWLTKSKTSCCFPCEIGLFLARNSFLQFVYLDYNIYRPSNAGKEARVKYTNSFETQNSPTFGHAPQWRRSLMYMYLKSFRLTSVE